MGLIVDFGDHHIARCVEFAEPEITGFDVLRRAGLELVVTGSGGMGFAVCDIDGTSGCPASNCFCKCQGSPCRYWSYHHLVNGSWQYSQLGASTYSVGDGDVEGWGWGEGQLNTSGTEPPIIPFDQICAPPATDTPVPTNTAIPPTTTPAPTDTPAPTPVPEPEAWFRLDENPVAQGSCTMLRWDTSNAQEIYLDGEAVGAIGSRQVCPATPTDYELRLVGLEEEEVFRLTLGVSGSAAEATPTAQPTAVPPSPTPDAGAVRAPTASPKAETAAGSSSPTSTTPLPAATPRTEDASASPTSGPTVARSLATPAQITQAQSTSTPVQVAAAEGPEDRAANGAEEQATTATGADSPSPLLPIGYIGFSLIAGGLVGWLIYNLKFRGQRA